MNILFIGRFYPKGIVETIVEDTRGKVGFSNHNFEMSLIHGFERLSDVNLRVLTAPMVFSFPHNNRNFRVKSQCYEEGKTPVHSVGFCNLAVINTFSTIFNLTKAIKKEITHFNGDKITVIVNTPSLILSKALFNAVEKIKGKGIKTILIVPDVPECMNNMFGKRNLKNLLVGQVNKRIAALSQQFDRYVLLTNAMNEFYKALPENYIVMEGLIDESRISACYREVDYTKNKEIILYTGTLARVFGVMELVDAFEKANLKNAEFWICGSGECASEIEQKASENNRIKFFGLVSSQKALELQSKATILANPRSASGEYTKYSFPSKTIEYLLAGRSVIMNRLPGVPNEYDKYIYYPNDETVEAWVVALKQIIEEDPKIRVLKSQGARQFILSNKSALAQCSRILNLAEK